MHSDIRNGCNIPLETGFLTGHQVSRTRKDGDGEAVSVFFCLSCFILDTCLLLVFAPVARSPNRRPRLHVPDYCKILLYRRKGMRHFSSELSEVLLESLELTFTAILFIGLAAAQALPSSSLFAEDMEKRLVFLRNGRVPSGSVPTQE